MTDDTQPQAIAEFSEHRHALATSRNDATHDLREAQQRAEAATAKLGGDPGNATLLKAALAARQQARDAADVLDAMKAAEGAAHAKDAAQEARQRAQMRTAQAKAITVAYEDLAGKARAVDALVAGLTKAFLELGQAQAQARELLQAYEQLVEPEAARASALSHSLGLFAGVDVRALLAHEVMRIGAAIGVHELPTYTTLLPKNTVHSSLGWTAARVPEIIHRCEAAHAQ